MQLNKNVEKLSYFGCVSILSDLEHVSMRSFNDCGSKNEVTKLMKEVIQINLDNGSLDEIEVIIVLSGE